MQYSLHVFDNQRAEQNDGVLECNRITRGSAGNAFYPGMFTRFTQMQIMQLQEVL